MKYKNRADLLIASGEYIKMQEDAGIVPIVKNLGHSCKASSMHFSLEADYEFPLAVVEGNPVFAGDRLYNRNGIFFIADSICYGTGAIVSDDQKIGDRPKYCSFNPPMPRTVMVELLREDANALSQGLRDVYSPTRRLMDACRKALESK